MELLDWTVCGRQMSLRCVCFVLVYSGMKDIILLWPLYHTLYNITDILISAYTSLTVTSEPNDPVNLRVF